MAKSQNAQSYAEVETLVFAYFRQIALAELKASGMVEAGKETSAAYRPFRRYTRECSSCSILGKSPDWNEVAT